MARVELKFKFINHGFHEAVIELGDDEVKVELIKIERMETTQTARGVRPYLYQRWDVNIIVNGVTMRRDYQKRLNEAKRLARRIVNEEMVKPEEESTNLTELEAKVLEAHRQIGIFHTGADSAEYQKADNFTWTDVEELALNTELPIDTVKGVVGSLVKKGLIDGDTNELALTEKGIDVAWENAPEPAAMDIEEWAQGPDTSSGMEKAREILGPDPAEAKAIHDRCPAKYR